MEKKLYRDEYHKKIGGVCAGLADYFETDVTLIRILFVITLFVSVGFVAYIILWVVLPKKGFYYNNFKNPYVDYTVPPQQPGAPYGYSEPKADGTYGTGNSFGNPWNFDPAQPMPPKQRSNAGVIVGAVLIILGSIILIDEFNLIPDFDFGRLWPVVLVIVGCSLIVSGERIRPWHKDNWNDTGKKEEQPAAPGAEPAPAEEPKKDPEA